LYSKEESKQGQWGYKPGSVLPERPRGVSVIYLG